MDTQLRQVSFSYGRRPILTDVSFTVRPGEVVVVAGPNGCGKSTLLSLMAGNLRPTAGEIVRPAAVGYVPQGSALFEELSVRDNLRFFASLHRVAMPAPLPLGLAEWASCRVSALSGGTKKRVSIACALLGCPELLLLDEPAASLDIRYREEIAGLIAGEKAAGRAIVCVSHDPAEFLSYYDRVVFLNGGRVRCLPRRDDGGDPERFRCLLLGDPTEGLAGEKMGKEREP